MALTSFGIREKWLRMLIKVLPSHPDIFTSLTNKERMEEAQYLLGGIGNKQVPAIKDWGIGIGLIERYDSANETKYSLTSLGKIIAQYDPQFEEQGTLWTIHYNLCANSSKIKYTDKSDDIWFYSRYSNSFGAGTFSRNEIKACLKKYKKDGKNYSDSVIEKMCMASLLETMSNTKIGKELGVMTIVDSEKNIYERRRPDEVSLHPAILAYMLYDWADFNSRPSMNTAEFYSNDSVACLMAIDEEQLRMYLNKIQDRYTKKILWVSWTAGLNSVAFEKNIPSLAILRAYYIEHQVGKDPLKSLSEGIELERIKD
jgi:hypothetical protein